MSATNILTAADVGGRMHKAVESLSKKPNFMRGGVGYMKLVSDYVDAVVNAKRDGKLVVVHGTQMPTEIIRRFGASGWRFSSELRIMPCLPAILQNFGNTVFMFRAVLQPTVLSDEQLDSKWSDRQMAPYS